MSHVPRSDSRSGGHDHRHGHSHGSASSNRQRLAIVLVLSAGYMVAEVVGGYLTNSLALLADAGHMFSDVAALGLSLFAIRIAMLPPSERQSYGFHRTEILAALANGATLVAISIFVLFEAYQRLRHPPAVAGGPMLAIATGGLAANIVGLVALHGGKEHNLNVRGAWLHVFTDALGSFGTIVGALFVWKLGWAWADPAVSVLISVLVIYSAWQLLRESVSILMEGTPEHLEAAHVREAIAEIPNVQDVHDLHIWSITSGMHALSAHIVAEPAQYQQILTDVHEMLLCRFHIGHCTVQCEPPGFVEPECAATKPRHTPHTPVRA